MMNLIKTRLSLLALVLGSACLCRAEAPSGVITLPIDNSTPVWDLSGGLAIEQPMIGAGGQQSPLAFSVDMTHDAKGKLKGSGQTIVQVGNDFVAADYRVSGKVSGGGDNPVRASFTVKLTGEDVVGGVSTKFTISIRYNLEAITSEQAFVGRASGSAKFSKLSSGKVKAEDVAVGLNPAMDGSWTVELNIVALSKLSGSGAVILPTGRRLPTNLSGSYSANSDTANVKLKGINEGKGTSVNLKLSNSGNEVQSLRGKVLGQTVRQ